MNIVDKADVHQLRNVISEMKETVHLYLEAFEGWVEQTEAVDKIVPYNFENIKNIVSDNVKECPEEETVAVNTVEEENLYEFGRLADKTLSGGEESNEVWSEDEFTHGKKGSDIFYGMPPIPNCPDPIVEPGPFHSLGPNDDMFVRQTYDNKQQLIFALSLKATREKFQFKTKHSNKNRYEGFECFAKQYAIELLLGSSKECFSKLPIYFHNLKMHNPVQWPIYKQILKIILSLVFMPLGAR
uniref:Uncharacterized protein n=1 Tax=Lactuca sativa TaxID=4236 RepID=A0A9R1WK14_LACSA|nr:hypothetical protein LSAT_V11C200067350 [Lactuca sativa]